MGLAVCFACAEYSPLAKAGGLGDACAALARYLAGAGHDLRVVLPYYAVIQVSGLEFRRRAALKGLRYSAGERHYAYSLLEAVVEPGNPRLYLVDCPELFARPELYGDTADEPLRFALLNHAALELCVRLAWTPALIHCHDWHAALVPLLKRCRHANGSALGATRTLLTLHNLAYQGVFPDTVMTDLGLTDCRSYIDGEGHEPGHFSFLRSGLSHADWISTVSPTYAQEILTPDYGCGLDALLRQRKQRLAGILNGIDHGEWDPARDLLLPHAYSMDDLRGKRAIKHALLERLDFGPGDWPLLAQISRLVEQKGIDLLTRVLPELLRDRSALLVALGTGEQRYVDFYRQLAAAFPYQVRFLHTYDPEMAHWIEAAADIFLMPSRFEPCGLNQMYSLRYGTIPVVRRTGGLADSVEPIDGERASGTGFVFDDYTPEALTQAIDRALEAYARPAAWERLMRNGMQRDFSWAHQGAEYEALYARILASEPLAAVNPL